jgi:hypothetical protein
VIGVTAEVTVMVRAVTVRSSGPGLDVSDLWKVMRVTAEVTVMMRTVTMRLSRPGLEVSDLLTNHFYIW